MSGPFPAPRAPAKRVSAVFFRTKAGNEPLREWLKALEPDDRRRIGEDVKTVEFGWPAHLRRGFGGLS